MQVYHRGFDRADGKFPTGLESAESLRGDMRDASLRIRRLLRIQNQESSLEKPQQLLVSSLSMQAAASTSALLESSESSYACFCVDA